MTKRLIATCCIIFSGLTMAQTPPTIEYLNSGKIVPKTLPFTEVVKVNDTLYLSGQLGNVPGTMKLVTGGIDGESRQTMENIQAVLEAHGYTLDNLVKCTVMLADISEWTRFNEIYRSYFTAHYPARSAFGVSGLALGARVEVDCIAVTGN